MELAVGAADGVGVAVVLVAVGVGDGDRLCVGLMWLYAVGVVLAWCRAFAALT